MSTHKSPSIYLAEALLSACLLMPVAAFAESLEVLIWPDYIDPEVVQEFEKKFDAEVNFNYFDSDESRDKLLAARSGEGYDVILLNGLQIEKYAQLRWLAPIDQQAVPNSVHIDDRWADATPGSREYGIAYFMGTQGILYRKDLYPAGFDSWNDLFKPNEALRNKISMSSASRLLMALALKASGFSANDVGPGYIKQATELLRQQKPFVRQYTYPSIGEDSAFLSGEVWAGLMSNGEVLALQQQHPDIAFTIPEEGGLHWIDFLTVARWSGHKSLAFDFINFLNEPEIAARQARFVYYPTPNTAAMKHLPEELLNNPVIYPDPGTQNTSEFLKPVPARTQKRINMLSVELMTE